MFEYAISCGEGTLLDYGITPDIEAVAFLFEEASFKSAFGVDDGDIWASSFESQRDWYNMMRFAPASPDCQTGK